MVRCLYIVEDTLVVDSKSSLGDTLRRSPFGKLHLSILNILEKLNITMEIRNMPRSNSFNQEVNREIIRLSHDLEPSTGEVCSSSIRLIEQFESMNECLIAVYALLKELDILNNNKYDHLFRISEGRNPVIIFCLT